MQENKELSKNSTKSITKSKSFKQCIAILAETFSKVDINPKLYWELLKDLNPKDLEKAVVWVAKNITQVYPGTNLTAIVRKRAEEESLLRVNQPAEYIKLENRHSAPPPKEWKDLLKKLR